MANTNSPEAIIQSHQAEVTPELVFQELRIAIGNDASPLLSTLEQTVSEAEQLKRRADFQIEQIESEDFDDFTKVHLKSNWIEAKRLASAMVNRAMLEAIHATIAIQKVNGNDSKVGSLTEIMEKILDVKFKKTTIGEFRRPETAG